MPVINKNSSWLVKTTTLLLTLIIIRAALQGLIRILCNVFGFLPLSFTEVVPYSLLFNFFFEVPGVVAYFLLFVSLQWTVKKLGKLNLWKQILISIFIVFPIARFWYLYDFRFMLNAHKHTWTEILQAQIGTGFQFFTFFFFSIIFAVSQYYLIERRQQTMRKT